jgi:hypothetical protein
LRRATTSNAAAITALATEYQRLLNRTSRIGLTRKVQNPGEIMIADIDAMVVSGTRRMLSNWGTEIATIPPYIPKTEFVRPISQIGATDRRVIVSSDERGCSPEGQPLFFASRLVYRNCQVCTDRADGRSPAESLDNFEGNRKR